MAVRSIASLSLTFGLVSIPVRLYSATESSAAIRFKLMSPGGARVRQTYVQEGSAVHEGEASPVRAPAPEPEPLPQREVLSAEAREPAVRPTTVVQLPTAARAAYAPAETAASEYEASITRQEMVKGYEFEKGRFVLFTAAELKVLEASSRQTIDIVSFIPHDSVDPIYFDKPYFLAPDKRASKPYSLLLRAMQLSGRCALAKWAWRSKEYVVQVRPTEKGLVLQQLLYADEVRSIEALNIELTPITDAELDLATRLIAQISAEAYDPGAFVDEEKQRILAAVELKISGQQVVSHAPNSSSPPGGADVVDLMAALRASLATKGRAEPPAPEHSKQRKPTKRAAATSTKLKTKKSA